MIREHLQNALNQQIQEEYCSWYFYRSAAAYCHMANLRGLDRWMRRRSKKKLDRATRLSDVVLERRGRLDLKPINPPNGHWDSPLRVLDAALEQERRLGASLARLVDSSLTEGDHATHESLEQIVSDQAEAEAKLETLADQLRLVEGAPAGLLMFDRALV